MTSNSGSENLPENVPTSFLKTASPFQPPFNHNDESSQNYRCFSIIDKVKTKNIKILLYLLTSILWTNFPKFPFLLLTSSRILPVILNFSIYVMWSLKWCVKLKKLLKSWWLLWKRKVLWTFYKQISSLSVENLTEIWKFDF